MNLPIEDSTSVVDYDYGDADSAYVCDDSSPGYEDYYGDDDIEGREDFSVVDYGYEEAVPRVIAVKTTPQTTLLQSNSSISRRTSLTTRKPQSRRSSLKTSENYQPRRMRRNSIACTEEIREVNLRDKKTSHRRRTSISFDDKEHVREIEPLVSFTTKEHLWNTDEENREARRQAKDMMIRMVQASRRAETNNNGKVLSSSDMPFCTRGLEMALPNKNRFARRLSRSSVLRVQDAQRGVVGMFCGDETTLADLYGRMSADSALEARRLGAQDYAEVKHDYRMTKRVMARMYRRGSC